MLSARYLSRLIRACRFSSTCPSLSSPAPNLAPQLLSAAKGASENSLPSPHLREQWEAQLPSPKIIRLTESHHTRLEFLYQSFKKSLTSILQGPTEFCIITAWLVSDNVILDMFSRWMAETNQQAPRVVAIDTLHLFSETFQTVEEMQRRYPEALKLLEWGKPKDCETKEDFIRLHGRFHSLPESEFDYLSKVEPLQRVLRKIGKEVSGDAALITINGRRNDQGKKRTSIPLWEKEKMTFNPLVNWKWEDVTLYCQHFNVPVNPLHKRVYVDPFNSFLGKQSRDVYPDFLEVTLDAPYFFYHQPLLRHALGSTARQNFYVWKSFGDTVTSVPVLLEEAERDGRFVHRHATECGIHTRVSNTTKAPHGGGALVDLMADLRLEAKPLELHVDYDKVIELNERQVCDLELLMVGGYSPLTGFMTRLEYESCVENMRLLEGSLWGLPVVLDSNDEGIQEGQRLLLRSSGMGGNLAVMKVEDVWEPDKKTEAQRVLGVDSFGHPYAEHMEKEVGKMYVGGSIIKTLQLPKRLWLPQPQRLATPAELRRRYKNTNEILGFQCRNPLHRAHVEMFTHSHNDDKAVVHPSIGPSKQDDFDARVRVPTYEILTPLLDAQGIDLFYFPYHMRLAGPRETIQHLICRKNYGFTKMIIGRDHAGCKDPSGKDFYGPYDSQGIAETHADELGIKPVPFQQLVYVPEFKIYMQQGEAQKRLLKTISISGTEFRRRVTGGVEVPSWYAFPEVVSLLVSSFRYHVTSDASLPARIADTTGQRTVAIHVADASPELSEEIIAVSRRNTTVPFFVVNDAPEKPVIKIIAPKKKGSSNVVTALNSLAELEKKLEAQHVVPEQQ